MVLLHVDVNVAHDCVKVASQSPCYFTRGTDVDDVGCGSAAAFFVVKEPIRSLVICYCCDIAGVSIFVGVVERVVAGHELMK